MNADLILPLAPGALCLIWAVVFGLFVIAARVSARHTKED